MRRARRAAYATTVPRSKSFGRCLSRPSRTPTRLGRLIKRDRRRTELKKVLLTGASGFIGYHCVEPLQARGYEVHAVSTKAREAKDARGVHWHECDITDARACSTLLQDVRPSHLLHLAWYVVPGK